jgi:glycerophosphoryl diester phosphodiesterase
MMLLLWLFFYGPASGADGGPFLVYAHRGGRSLAPENTLAAVKAGLTAGTDFVDVDVVMSKDGELIVSHDLALNPNIVRDSRGRFIPADSQPRAVKGMNYSEIRNYDVGRLRPNTAYASYFPEQRVVDGTSMPTLREVIRYAMRNSNGKIRFNIEMKTDPTNPSMSPDPKEIARGLYRVLKDEKVLDRSEIQSFDFRSLQELQRIDPGTKTSYLTSTQNQAGGVDDFASERPKVAGRWTGGKRMADLGGSIPAMVRKLGGSVWSPEDRQLRSAEDVKRAQALGLKVVPWTWPEESGNAFDPKRASQLIDWGVDGLITDDPGKLAKLLVAKGRKAPPVYRIDDAVDQNSLSQNEADLRDKIRKIMNGATPAQKDFKICADADSCFKEECEKNSLKDIGKKTAARPFIMMAETQPARGTFMMSHGLSDSPYVTAQLGEHLKKRGFNVVSILLRDHGADQSPAPHLSSMVEAWGADVDQGLKLAREISGTAPVFASGFSASGLILTDRVRRNKANVEVAGLMLFDPAMAVSKNLEDLNLFERGAMYAAPKSSGAEKLLGTGNPDDGDDRFRRSIRPDQALDLRAYLAAFRGNRSELKVPTRVFFSDDPDGIDLGRTRAWFENKDSKNVDADRVSVVPQAFHSQHRNLLIGRHLGRSCGIRQNSGYPENINTEFPRLLREVDNFLEARQPTRERQPGVPARK